MAEIAPIPLCGICGNEKVRLSKTTEKKFEAIFVCNTGKPNARMPCDGFAHAISLLNE